MKRTFSVILALLFVLTSLGAVAQPAESFAEDASVDDQQAVDFTPLSATEVNFSIPGGMYATPVAPVMTVDAAGAQIWYTLNGGDPVPNMPGSFLHDPHAPRTLTDRTPETNFLSAIPAARLGCFLVYTDEHFIPPKTPVAKATIVRARAFNADGTPLSTAHGSITTHSFFVMPDILERYDGLPIISLTVDYDDFFSDERGIYVRGGPNRGYQPGQIEPNWEWRGAENERPVHMEWFEVENGSFDRIISSDIGVRIHGGGSRRVPQKSLRLYARNDRGGLQAFQYDLFQGAAIDSRGNNVEYFRRLILRNAGNEGPGTMFRDAGLQQLAQGLNFRIQAYRPSVVFINGEFWGVYNIRERYDNRYLAAHFGVHHNDVAHLEFEVGGWSLSDGRDQDLADFRQLEEFFANNHFGGGISNRNYQYIQQQMCIDSFIDLYITQMYWGNIDWPANNVRIWRYFDTGRNTANADQTILDGRWRWMLVDLDSTSGFSFSLDYWQNPISRLIHYYEYEGLHWGTTERSTRMFRQLMTNQDFRNRFINRMNDLMNTHFDVEPFLAMVDQAEARIENVMSEQIHRWSRVNSMPEWRNNVAGLREFGENRKVYMLDFMQDTLNLGAPVQVITMANTTQGRATVNGMLIGPETQGVQNAASWTGTYFTGMTQTFGAVPNAGFQLSHFVVNNGGNVSALPADRNGEVQVMLAGNTTVTPVFIAGEANLPVYFDMFNTLPANWMPLEGGGVDLGAITNTGDRFTFANREGGGWPSATYQFITPIAFPRALTPHTRLYFDFTVHSGANIVLTHQGMFGAETYNIARALVGEQNVDWESGDIFAGTYRGSITLEELFANMCGGPNPYNPFTGEQFNLAAIRVFAVRDDVTFREFRILGPYDDDGTSLFVNVVGAPFNITVNGAPWDGDPFGVGEGDIVVITTTPGVNQRLSESGSQLPAGTVIDNYTFTFTMLDERVFVNIVFTRPGDINGDGVVNEDDLMLLQAYLLGMLASVDLFAADVNADGVVDWLDFLYLLRYIQGENIPLGTYMPAGAAMTNAELRVGDVTASQGDWIGVPIIVDANDGLTMLALEVDYDSDVLELDEIDGWNWSLGLVGGGWGNIASFFATGLIDPDFGVSVATGTGELAMAIFRVRDGAALGDTTVTINATFAAVEDGSGGYNFVEVTATAGIVTVAEYIPPTSFVHVEAFGGQSAGIDSHGTLWQWGSMSGGRPRPVMDSVADVALGQSHTLILDTDGVLWAWGGNWRGQLGDGTFDWRGTPVKIMENVISIAAGQHHSLAVTADGNVWQWGDEQSDWNEPWAMAAASEVSLFISRPRGSRIGIEQSRYSADTARADAMSRRAVCTPVGDAPESPPPVPTPPNSGSNIPVQVAGLSGVTQVAAGREHSLAIDNRGRLWAWGANGSGQLGDGTFNFRATPVHVMSTVAAASGGNGHTLALTMGGNVYAWGGNWDGQVGDGTWQNRNRPVRIMQNATVISAGDWHSMALGSNGAVWAWGNNWDGQIGDGTFDNERNRPVQVKTNAIAIAAGGWHSLAVSSQRGLYAWGANWSGQLGDQNLWWAIRPTQIIAGYFWLTANNRPNSWAIPYVSTAYTHGLISEAVFAGTRFQDGIPRHYIADLGVRFLEVYSGMSIDEFIKDFAANGGTLYDVEFPDTTDPYALALAQLGIIRGGEVNGVFGFHPDRTLNRVEAAAMLTRLADALGYDITDAPDAPFDDQHTIPSTWGRPNTNFMYSIGIMGNTVSPENIPTLGYLFRPFYVFPTQQMITAMVRMLP
ncbi:MAG: CotH kinase family protein [Oscillospiraceae bacterium]|nr:CotH kinase family protein [Oscillospiraceae bacterium]